MFNIHEMIQHKIAIEDTFVRLQGGCMGALNCVDWIYFLIGLNNSFIESLVHAVRGNI